MAAVLSGRSCSILFTCGYQSWARVIFLSTRRSVLMFYRLVTAVFLTLSSASSTVRDTRHPFRKASYKKLLRHKFSIIKTCSNADTRSQPSPTPTSGQTPPSPHPTPFQIVRVGHLYFSKERNDLCVLSRTL